MQEALLTRPKALRFKPDAIPLELRQLDRWCVWKYVQLAGGKWTKVPINARTGKGASSTNPATWCSFAEAQAALLDDRELAGLGFFLGEGICGIDVDHCMNEYFEWSALAESVQAECVGYAEISPSGRGLHIITRGTIPGSKADHRQGLEVYDRARFFAITGHSIPGRSNAIPSASIDLTPFYVKHFGSYSPGSELDEDLSALANAKGPLAGWSLERVRDELLTHISSDCHYNEWLEVGAALHHQGEADEDWCELWDSWSAEAGERYTPDLCSEKWDTFGTHLQGRGAVTLATIIMRVKKARSAERFGRVDVWKLQINATTDRAELLEALPAKIARDVLVDEKIREELAQCLKRRLKEVLHTPYSITKVRAWLTPVLDVAPDVHAPEWLKPYVYVTDEDKFFDVSRKVRFSRMGFNALNNRNMPRNDSGDPIKQAADAATDLYGIRVVDCILYHPSAGLFFEMDGKACVNAYDDSQIPVMPPVLLDDEERAVEIVKQHLTNILPDERERQLFTSWLAYVVQNPGVKVRWAPYLCGVPGDGKSFFVSLLGACMGTAHVKAMNGDMLASGSGFSDWAVNRCVTVIEETKLHGQNKFDAANRIKPFITNPVIDVHPKGRASYNAPNTVQYMLLSNHLDGMPVSDDDRRFMFLQTAYSIHSLRRFREADPTFYNRLFDAVADYPGAMRYWLMHFQEWHPDFAPDGNAPLTEMRETVIDMSESDADAAFRDVYAERPGGVTGSYVAAVPFVSAAAERLGPNSGYRRSVLARLAVEFLRKRGCRICGKDRPRVGPQRVQTAIWCHESHTPDPLNWLDEAKRVIEKSFADAAARDFLD
ncbi:DUF5906 domain-containing protein [Paraburkholderia youngii]|uniref:DUF5906 domain-containing protein n=1 Tax=Paraburkholderia youngii TaxID=2782701 RepID=UPI00158FB64F|nr:DUF5906 domain-containing protein [Paraburkholderia youngii]NUX58687.1 hypothetical protein [Paraburkholderia youngii]